MTAGLARSEAWLADYQRKRATITPLSTQSVIMTLPWPPSVNHSGRDGFRGGRKTAAYKQFLADVERIAREYGWPRIEGRLSVNIEASPPDERRRDLDNLQKAVLDALQHAGLYLDDCAIDELSIRRMPGRTGSITVSVRGM